MDAIRIDDVSYRYPGRDDYALRSVSLAVGEGEFVLVKGSSGSGKSTLCRLLNGLIPRFSGGEIEGSVFVDGVDVSKQTVADMSSNIGLLFQEPENQIVMSNVANEIAFGLENLGMERDSMRQRIGWAASKLGIAGLLDDDTSRLSGGQKQRVALASILALKPRILALDEPTSQLDSTGRRELFDLLAGLKKDGLTILLVEHNLSEAAPYVDWVFDLDLKAKMRLQPPAKLESRPPRKATGGIVLEVKGLTGGYPRRVVFEDVSLEVFEGECLAIIGDNGCGKTTLVKHFNGLMKPCSGSVTVCGCDTKTAATEELAKTVAYLSQQPTDMLFCETVEDELKFTLRNLEVKADVDRTLALFGLEPYKNLYPRDLSVGQRQRVALASVMVSNPKLLVLDEPTRGIDEKSRAALTATLRGHLESGGALVLVTQDESLADELSSKKATLRGGRLET